MLVWGGDQNLQTFFNSIGCYCAVPCPAPSVYYQDHDGDGHGDPSRQIQACDPPTGFSDNDDDCDDSDANTYRGAPEVMDGRDNQCTSDPGFGVVDEISGVTSWDGSTYRWTPQPLAAKYQVMCSTRADFLTDCVALATDVPLLDDRSEPKVDTAYFYLVRSSAPFAAGSWGQRSDGSERDGGCLVP
jgi:hypothetical protein